MWLLTKDQPKRINHSAYSAVREEISSFDEKFVFGASLDLDLLGIDMDDNTLIPGLSVASSRAKHLAAWMNGLEVCSIAEAWESVKKATGGLHFLAIQDDLDSDDCVGFWLLIDLPPPPV